MKTNFYNVEIGTTTRRGGFLKHHSFVVGVEDKGIHDVRNYYTDKYSGFVVNVTSVEMILNDDIKKPSEEERVEQYANPVKRIKRYEYRGNMQEEIRSKWLKIRERQRDFDREVDVFTDELTKHIKSKYGEVADKVEITNFHPSRDDVRYEVILSGVFEEEYMHDKEE